MQGENIDDKFSGSLLGVAIGDALGTPAVNMTPFIVKQKYQILDAFYPSIKFKTSPGDYGFSTQVALIIAKALMEDKEINKKNLSDYYLKLYKTTNRNIESEISESLQRLDNGIEYDKCASNSISDSFLPRMIPVGLWSSMLSINDKELVKNCKDILLPTHNNKNAVIIGFVIAKIINECIKNQSSISNPYEMYGSENSLLSRIISLVRNAEEKTEENNSDKIWVRLQETSRMLQKNCTPESFVGTFGNIKVAKITGLLSIFCFMRSPDDFSSIRIAASLGGSSNISASLVGGMCGAFAGTSFIPKDMIEHVQNGSKILLLGEQMYNCLSNKDLNKT